MKKFEVEIQGSTPLLVNRFVCEQLDQTKRKIVTGKQTSVEDKLYMVDGKPYIPCEYLERAMIDAGKDFKGKGRSTLSKIMGAMVSILPDALIISPSKWVIDVRSAVNPTTKGRMMVQRPKFVAWRLKFELVIETDDIPTERIKEILDFAGMYVGIGDYRPVKKGKFGKFMVTSFKEKKE